MSERLPIVQLSPKEPLQHSPIISEMKLSMLASSMFVGAMIWYGLFSAGSSLFSDDEKSEPTVQSVENTAPQSLPKLTVK